MKKFIFAFIFTFSLGAFAFSQASGEFSASDGDGLITMKAGGFFNFEPILGNLSDYTVMNLGGGATYELGFHVLPSLDVGGNFHIAVNGNVLKEENADLLDYVWNMKFYLGGFARIPFGESGIVFQPELAWGFVFYFPKASEDYVNSLESFYSDQMIQIAASFRYTSPMLFESKLEFELSPLYSLGFEQEDLVHTLGFRLGALYRFM